jgi:cohesin complex subunit SCC1
MPDTLTDADFLPSMIDLDESLLQTQPSGVVPEHGARVGRNEDITLMDWDSALLPNSIEQGRGNQGEMLVLEEDDLELDIGEGFGRPVGDETSVHVGRGALPGLPIDDDFLSDDNGFQGGDDFGLNAGESFRPGRDGTSFGLDDGFGVDEAIGSAAREGFNFDYNDQSNILAPTPGRAQRTSQSPLSSIRSSAERDLEDEFQPNADSGFYDESLHQPQRAKKRKILQPDMDTVIHSAEIKQQQADRSKILKPASFLPRDPMTLTLMAMQRNGSFVSNILGDGRAKGWAPELRGILSLDIVRKSGELKRKRDSGIADMGEESDSPTAGKQPRLELGEDDDNVLPMIDDGFGDDTSFGATKDIIQLPADAARPTTANLDSDDGGLAFNDDGDDFPANSPLQDNFDDTMAPLVHPADSGPVSLGTQHAVHLLRDRFGAFEEGASQKQTASQQKKSSVLFQDLLPESRTTKQDATKMFFEVLVLATKDAVKVEQPENVLGGPIRVRGKRGLWGAWAEREAGGEIAEKALVDPAREISVAA